MGGQRGKGCEEVYWQLGGDGERESIDEPKMKSVGGGGRRAEDVDEGVEWRRRGQWWCSSLLHGADQPPPLG